MENLSTFENFQSPDNLLSDLASIGVVRDRAFIEIRSIANKTIGIIKFPGLEEKVGKIKFEDIKEEFLEGSYEVEKTGSSIPTIEYVSSKLPQAVFNTKERINYSKNKSLDDIIRILLSQYQNYRKAHISIDGKVTISTK